jgi:hypothetical protein
MTSSGMSSKRPFQGYSAGNLQERTLRPAQEAHWPKYHGRIRTQQRHLDHQYAGSGGNKRIRYFLQQQNNDKYRDPKERAQLYQRYFNQFRNEQYHAADFPASLGEMKANFSALRQFLLKRFELSSHNDSLKSKVMAFLDNKDFQGTEEYVEMLAICGNFIDLDPGERLAFSTHFERERRSFQEFDIRYLRFLSALYRFPGISSPNDEDDECRRR